MTTEKHSFFVEKNFLFLINHRKGAKSTLVESYINNGAVDELKENLGISHLLEHVCTDGWKKCGAKGCNEWWKEKGAIMNASTGQTYVNYYIKALPEYLDDQIDYILNLSVYPDITHKRCEKEKSAVKNELLIHKQNPSLPIYNILNKMLFSVEGLVLQDNIDQQINNLKKINYKDLQKWANKYYGSGQTIFSITGDFKNKTFKNNTIAKIKKQATKILKKADGIKYKRYYSNVFLPGINVKYIKNDGIDNTTIYFSFHSPIFQRDIEYWYISLFKEFVNNSMQSVLMRELREKRQLIYTIHVENYTTTYGSFIIIETSCENNDIQETVKVTTDVLQKLATGSFDKDLLESCKNVWQVKFQNRCKNNDWLSTFYSEQYVNQFNDLNNATIHSPDEVVDIIKTLKQSDFIQFIRKYLVFGNMKLAYQGKKKEKNLRNNIIKNLGIKNVVIVD